MKTIYKYELKITDTQAIALPIGATILHLDVQNNKPCIWALIPAGAGMHAPKERRFHTYGTGHQIPDLKLKYVGSYQTSYHTPFVGHVFEEIIL